MDNSVLPLSLRPAYRLRLALLPRPARLRRAYTESGSTGGRADATHPSRPVSPCPRPARLRRLRRRPGRRRRRGRQATPDQVLPGNLRWLRLKAADGGVTWGVVYRAERVQSTSSTWWRFRYAVQHVDDCGPPPPTAASLGQGSTSGGCGRRIRFGPAVRYSSVGGPSSSWGRSAARSFSSGNGRRSSPTAAGMTKRSPSSPINASNTSSAERLLAPGRYAERKCAENCNK